MKKLLSSICVIAMVVIAISCKNKSSSEKQASKGSVSDSTVRQGKFNRKLITLNGIKLDDANELANNFETNPGIYDTNSATNVWFSKKYIDSLDDLLKTEQKTMNTDGFRIYFAKQADSTYAIVIVSTRQFKLTNGQFSGTHTDYFRHDANFLHTALAKGEISHGISTSKGALLYDPNSQCPLHDGCDPLGDHYLPCTKAKTFVENYTTNATDFVTTESEWFNLGLLSDIRKELDAQTNGADGLRIYFAKKTTDGTLHFVLVTTKRISASNHRDYHECLFSHLRGDDNGEQCPQQCEGTTWGN